MPVVSRKSGKSKAAEQSGLAPLNRYAAFLRGINVGGRKIIKMEELSRIFTSAGFSGVKTLIQSGNVIFNVSADDIEALKSRVEDVLLKELGYRVEVFLLPLGEIIEMLKSKPFGHLQKDKKIKFYVSLLSGQPAKKLKLPLFSEKKDLEVLEIVRNKVYILSHEINGSFGFPNNFIEEITGFSATTRNWNTIEKLVKE
ncbi:MAG: DUF1697 domain-containing protein [Bacteroidetes bacterium]|nr:DUF1697 domain-containing protein [Bacteroidota bacterium]